MESLNDWELRECRQSLLIAIVVQAVDDAVIYRLTQERFPTPENGDVPDGLFEGIENDIYKKVSKMKFPKKLKCSDVIYDDPYAYAEHLISQRRTLITSKYESIIKDGRSAELFLADEERLNFYTDLSVDETQRIVAKKKQLVSEQIERGEASKMPPYKIPKRHTLEGIRA